MAYILDEAGGTLLDEGGNPISDETAPAVITQASRWLWYSSVPGMAVPGMACPGMAGTSGYPFWLYIGHVPGLYFDYVDTTTQQILSPFPGLWYTMYAVSNRAGLTVPPPDTRWLTTANRVSFEVVFFPHIAFAAARQANADLQAANAAKPVPEQPQGSPRYEPAARTALPSEAAVMLAAARARNAELQAAVLGR